MVEVHRGTGGRTRTTDTDDEDEEWVAADDEDEESLTADGGTKTPPRRVEVIS